MDQYSGIFRGKDPYWDDQTAPSLVSVVAENNTTVLVTFSEAVTEDTAEQASNYTIDGLTISSAERLAENNAQVRLVTSNQNDVEYTLTVSNVTDFAGNAVAVPGNVLAFQGDACPSVVSVIPVDSTHVEVVFSETVNIDSANVPVNYTIRYKDNTPLQVYSAARESSETNKVMLTTYSQKSGTNNYSLVVAGVKDNNGNEVLPNSTLFNGAANTDTTKPTIQYVYSINITTVRVTFSESVDETSAEIISNYSLSGGFSISSAARRSDNTAQVDLVLTDETDGENLTLTVNNVSDENENEIENNSQKSFVADARPKLSEAVSEAMNSVILTFSEAITALSSECSGESACAAIYSINNGLSVTSASRISATQVRLSTSNQNNIQYTVTISNNTIADINGNTINTSCRTSNFDGRNDDTVHPVVTGVKALSVSTIEVSFSEAVDTTSAENASNYTLSSGSINKAERQSDTSKVVLTTSTLSDGDYTLTTQNVTDLAANQIDPNPTNSNFGVHFTKPEIVNIYQYDCDHDGNIDQVTVQFNRSIEDSSISLSDIVRFKLAGVSFVNYDTITGGTATATCSITTQGGMDPQNANDQYITLFTNDATVTGTDRKSFAYTSSSGRVTDLYDQELESVTITYDDSKINDRAKPVLTKASADSGDTALKVFFSEAVKTASGSGVCSGTIDVASDLLYNDVSSSNVGGLATTGADLNGCDGDLDIDTASSVPFNSADLFVDTINAKDNELFDIDGNSAITTPVLIKGIIKPYVVNVLSVTSTKLRITFSEAMLNDGSANAANNIANYTYQAIAGSGCNATLAGTAPIHISGDKVFEIETASQTSTCTYKLTVSNNVVDQNENAKMTDPKFGTFQGNEPLRVVSAYATSANTFAIVFSKDVKEGTDTGGAENISYYTIPTSLGNVTAVQRDAMEKNKVHITHQNTQGVGVYSVIVSTSLRNDANTENLQPNPKDRTTFIGFGGTVEKVEDGPIFTDPFADGTSFAFSFEYGGKIYLGPNENNSGVFRFDPDGANSTLVTFKITSSSGTFYSFGANISRPVVRIEDNGSGGRRYYITPDTDLTAYNAGTAKLVVTGCTDTNNNITATTISIVNDGSDYVEVPTTFSSINYTGCKALIYSNNGPAGNVFDGVDSFVKARVGTTDYLVFGGHNEGGAGFNEIYFTTDMDDTLDISYCDISSATLGNTMSLQMIYGFEGSTRVYTAFASDSASGKPIIAIFDFSVTGAACKYIDKSETPLNGTGNQSAKKFPYLGGSGSPANSATNIGIDSIVYFGGAIYIANNGGISKSTTVPPTTYTDFTNVMRDGVSPWTTGTTRQIPSISKLRPGEKGIPFMVVFKNELYVARNRTDSIGELWKYNGSAWTKVFDTAESKDDVYDPVTDEKIANGDGEYNTAISLVHPVEAPTGTQKYLYVGFDNETKGAQIFRSSNGDKFYKIGKSGLGPENATQEELIKNKHIVSHASIFYDGKSYLYLNVGCLSDFSDNGACDRNYESGKTNFSIKVFRQIDTP